VKQVILMAALMLVGANAGALEVLVPVESKTENKYYLQIIVPGAKQSEVAQMTKIIQSVVPEVTKKYSTNWLMDNRSVIMARLEKEFKQASLFCDGIGVLRLRIQSGKVIDVE
jgi:hypothetical protein